MPKVIYLLLSVVTAAQCNQYLPPALIWGSAVHVDTNAPPVQATPKNVAGVIASEDILVFMLDKLSLEDFGKLDSLKKIVTEQKSLFFPEVESEQLVQYLLKEKKNVQVLHLNSFEELEKAVSKVNFEKKVGVLTARKSSWRSKERSKRATNGPFYPGQESLIHLQNVNLTVSHHEEWHRVSYPQVTSLQVTPNGTSTSVLFRFDGGDGDKLTIKTFSLELILKSRGGYMMLNQAKIDVDGTLEGKQVKFSEELKSTVELLYPLKSSFHCTKFGPMRAPLKSADNFTASVIFEKFQIQVVNGTKFLPVYECVGFFTPGIWMGIFMNLILISIMTWGIYMIMSVKTMDRFDDPKGKPISFAGSE